MSKTLGLPKVYLEFKSGLGLAESTYFFVLYFMFTKTSMVDKFSFFRKRFAAKLLLQESFGSFS